MKKNNKEPYWKHKKLSEMTNTEWEMLCDGCGKCCIHKIKDDKTGKIFLTNVACKLSPSLRPEQIPDAIAITFLTAPPS